MQNKVVGINDGGRLRRSDLAVRVLALVLTLAAAIVLGVDKQTTTVTVTIVPSLPPVNLPVTAKWLHMSAFVYVLLPPYISNCINVIQLYIIMQVFNYV